MELDLNLVLILDSLYRTKNVSKTASEFGLSQSAISHSLTRLRDHYDDQLFVRIAKGVAPTQFAIDLKPDVDSFIQQSNKISQKREGFDPKKVIGRIVISTTDYFEIVVMSKLLMVIKEKAPHVQLSLRPTLGELPKKELESGQYDIAIAGFFKEIPQGYFQTNLFEDYFETAFNKSRKRKELSVEDFYRSDHALITLQGDFKDGLERKVAGKKLSRKIIYGSSSFTGMAWTLSASDMLLTAPSKLLMAYKKYFPLEVVPCPVDIKPIQVKAYWHSLTHGDPLKKWFREELKKACLSV